MGHYDVAFRRLAARYPGDIAWLVLREENLRVTVVDSAVQALRREVDFAGRVETATGTRFVLHVECEREPHSAMAGRLLEYRAVLSAREGLPVVSAVVRLQGDGPAHEVIVHREVVGSFEPLVFRYHEVTLSAVDAREMLATAGHVGVLALVPLGRAGEQEEVLRAAVERIRESGVTPEVRADLLAAASVFAGLRSDAELVRALVRRDEMKESVIYQEIFQEGKAEGRAEGEAEGRAKGKAEGKAEGKADAIVHVLERRFGNVPPVLRGRILATHDADRLAALLDLALTTASLADVARRLPSTARSRSPRARR